MSCPDTQLTETDRIINNYTPAPDVCHWHRWEEIEDFVRDCARKLELPADMNPDQVCHHLRTLAGFITWVKWGLYEEPSIESAFTHQNVQYYCLHAMSLDEGSGESVTWRVRGMRRSLLIRAGWKLNPDGYGGVWQRPVAYEKALQLYNDRELRKVEHWAANHVDPERKANALTTLALVLRTGELAALTVDDIEETADGTLVVHPSGYRGAGPRATVVDHRFEDQVRDWPAQLDRLCEQGKPGEYLVCPHLPGRTSDMIRDYFKRDRTRVGETFFLPDFRRLRNTWIARHIMAGIPEDVLCSVAGLKSLSQFRDLMAEAGERRLELFYGALRGQKEYPRLCLA